MNTYHDHESTAKRGDRQSLKTFLNSHVDAVARLVLGPPSRVNRHQARWGESGKLVVEVAGPKAGLCFDHSRGAGGDALRLLQERLMLDDAGAIAWARDHLNYGAGDE
jgi:hypothetical protein